MNKLWHIHIIHFGINKYIQREFTELVSMLATGWEIATSSGGDAQMHFLLFKIKHENTIES